MTTQTTTETATSDNGTEHSETEGGAGTENSSTEHSETEGGAGTGSEPTEEDGRLKALRRKLDEQAEELGKFRKAEEERKLAEMTETDRLKAELDAKVSELEELRTNALRSAIVTEYGLPAELAERLKGATEEELKADAEELSKLIPKRTPPPAAGDAGMGGRADTPPTDPLELHRSWLGNK